MLNIFYGDMKEAVYNTASYFKYDYEEDWIVDPMVKEMIQDVDKSVVIDSGIIDSPVLGKIPPIGLSGGVKTLILVKFEPEKVFNVSTCGDNCAKWLLLAFLPQTFKDLCFRKAVDQRNLTTVIEMLPKAELCQFLHSFMTQFQGIPFFSPDNPLILPAAG